MVIAIGKTVIAGAVAGWYWTKNKNVRGTPNVERCAMVMNSRLVCPWYHAA